MCRSPWKICVFSLVLGLVLPVLNAFASDYHIEPMDQLCEKAADPEAYDSSLLKSLKFLVQGEDGWIYRSTDDFTMDFNEDGEYTDLKAFVGELATKGTRLLMVYPPTKALMYHKGIPASQFDFNKALASYKKKLKKLADLGIIVPDLSPLIGASDADTYYFKRDIHWTPEGARKTAKIVADTIRKTGLIKEQKSFKVVNAPAGLVMTYGGLGKGIKKLCGDRFIDQYVEGYTTSSSFEGGGDDLFADEPEAQVVLLGTSFSALPKFNFNGFLQEDLKAPITNYAVSGGGDKGAWLTYLNHGDFVASPPKLIIWEFPAYYILDGSDLFAQLKPLLTPTIEKKNLLVNNSVTLGESQGPHNTLFFSDKMLHISPSKLAFDLQLSDPEINNIRFCVWYKDGRRIEKGMKMPPTAKMGGHFVFSLFDNLIDDSSDLVAMELTTVESKPLQEYLTTAANNSLGVAVKVYRMDN